MRQRYSRLGSIVISVFILGFVILQLGIGHAQTTQVVYKIPVKQSVEQGLRAFLERAFVEAKEHGADLIVLEIDTPGGEVGAASDIGGLIRSQQTPVVAYVVNEAFSAGTYIALNSDKIIMSPGSAIGAAAPIDLAGNMAGEKLLAAWSKKMTSAAQINNRDPVVAEAMVNPQIVIPGLTKRGEILALDAAQAEQVGYSEGTAKTVAEAIELVGYGQAKVFSVEPTAGEKVARFVTNPFIIPLLLTIGIVGIVIEILTPGFGVPGILGATSLTLYFFGHYIAGYADLLHIILFVFGLLLLVIEMFVPSFGVLGILGIIAVISGVVMAAYDTTLGFVSLGIACIVAVVVGFLLIKFFGHRGVWNKFILKDQQKNEEGYVSHHDWSNLVGAEGEAITTLRPSGTAEINEQLIDVVSEGGYIERGKRVRVLKVEGTRVVVRQVD
ncbi:serine protease [Ammoniphilus oxalaticus]|uniref:Serine protease n=1 Tax=Ammoniphilus oxalaticus TaxID=66863 RepID=A0A419SJ72_9BACL|nr:nodulation protein NfeD [Ammoniphilus oxalaticus]RKD24000.1 serine protease [Ammoniphilus oxalaticus]